MTKNESFISALLRVLILAAIAVVPSACGGQASPVPAATLVPTLTATLTPLPTETLTPQPTSTSTPTPVPTPAAVGDAVQYGSLEITVIKTGTHDLIVPGGLYYYRLADAKNIFLDLGVLVKNQDPGHAVSVTWKDVAITQADGTSRSPAFADTKMLDAGSQYDPFRIGISTQASEDAIVLFEKDTYLRLIYVVGKNQALLFGIEDSPTISFTIGH